MVTENGSRGLAAGMDLKRFQGPSQREFAWVEEDPRSPETTVRQPFGESRILTHFLLAPAWSSQESRAAEGLRSCYCYLPQQRAECGIEVVHHVVTPFVI